MHVLIIRQHVHVLISDEHASKDDFFEPVPIFTDKKTGNHILYVVKYK